MPAPGLARTLARVAVLAGLAWAGPASAQEYSRYLQCSGQLAGPGPATPVHADLALRFAARTALVQRSNVLPVGEVLDYVPTAASYSFSYRLPVQGTQVVAVPGWLAPALLVLHPNLALLNQIRIGIDRQTGTLGGVMLNEAEQPLAQFSMGCRSVSAQDLGAPRF